MNVIMFALDACPTSALGPYGNEWVGTPNLDWLAAEGVVFDRHISDHPTLGSARRTWLPPATRTTTLAGLPDALDNLGEGPWRLLVECDRLNPPWTIPQDVFDAYIEDEDQDENDEPEDTVAPWADPPVGWFDRNDLASWEYLHSSVAAALTAFDAELGVSFDLLRQRKFDRSAAWVFTAARGFPLGEHGIIGPFRPWLHEELVHLPLIVRLPEAAQAGRRVSALSQPIDLAGWPGGGIAPLFDGSAASIRTQAFSSLEVNGGTEWAVRTANWAYLLPVEQAPDDDPREPMLFRKPDDYWEVNNVRSQHTDVADELECLTREAFREPQ